MANDNEPIRLNYWIASSLVQKAIRRGDLALACQAIADVHAQSGEGVWRRLTGIAYEDVGLGDLDLVQWVTRLAVDRDYRYSQGGEREMMLEAVSAMALSVKDRSTDYLLSVAQDDRDLDGFRDWCYSLSPEAQTAIIVDHHVPLEKRATAMWCAVSAGPSRSFKTGEPLATILTAIQNAGISSDLTGAVMSAARLVREPIIVMLPILASVMQHFKYETSVIEEELPPTRFSCGVPCYTADRHTSSGKGSIKRWLLVNPSVADTVGEYVQDFRAADVLGFAVFHCNGGPVRRRLEWERSRALQQMGTRIDLEKSGCPPEGVEPIMQVVRDQMASLDDLRVQRLGCQLGSTPPTKSRGKEV